jgi:hypothetical protein
MSEYENLDSNKRQKEIEEVANKVVSFNPSKIAVEMITDKNDELNRKFINYKSNTYELEMNEIYQLGFRVAKKLNHNEIYAIDWMGHNEDEKDFGKIYNWANEKQPTLFKEIFGQLSAPELTNEKSVLDYYKELNEPLLLKSLHKMYVNMARIGTFDNYVGMDWLSWWYKRNLILFSNITRIINSSEDRILVIIGASHCSIISNFFEESNCCSVIPAFDYLFN